jgi:2-amino-4-hydroxy-6-hydroxymethyldihydropteridine diphosphokinase
VETRAGETPEAFLEKLQQIENDLGRTRSGLKNEARKLDLDLIAFGQEIRNTPKLLLPHPRVLLRRFVLEPLAEIAPEFILPGQTQNVAQLLAKLD